MTTQTSTLRVAYAGHDFFSSCLQALVERPDIDLALCLTDGPDGQPTDNVRRLAHEANASILLGRWSQQMIDAVNDAEIDLLVCAAYMYRIPIEELSISRAVNIHPTLLPEGRGPDPLPYLARDHRDLCGITIHEMAPALDRGALLLQEPITPDQNDGANEIFLKLFAAAPLVLNRLLENLDGYFENKSEQAAGSYWPEPGAEQKTLSAVDASVQDISDLHSQFGMFNIMIALADGTLVAASRLTASRCIHSYSPGRLVARMRIGWIIAVKDGLIRLDSPTLLNSFRLER